MHTARWILSFILQYRTQYNKNLCFMVINMFSVHLASSNLTRVQRGICEILAVSFTLKHNMSSTKWCLQFNLLTEQPAWHIPLSITLFSGSRNLPTPALIRLWYGSHGNHVIELLDWCTQLTAGQPPLCRNRHNSTCIICYLVWIWLPYSENSNKLWLYDMLPWYKFKIL